MVILREGGFEGRNWVEFSGIDYISGSLNWIGDRTMEGVRFWSFCQIMKIGGAIPCVPHRRYLKRRAFCLNYSPPFYRAGFRRARRAKGCSGSKTRA